MRLKNYQEDVVLRAIEIALEGEPDLLEDQSFVNDVAAYVLNRIPPRYLMSERGFLRLALEHSGDDDNDASLANVIELMMLVNRGLELVRGRRGAPVPERARRSLDPGDPFGDAGDGVPAVEYVHNYPQIIGQVVDASTGAPVDGATVTLHLDGDLVPPAARGWHNPYTTREQTRGHFSFWPAATRSEEQELTVELLFTVEREGYLPLRRTESVRTDGEFDAANTIRGDRILSLQPLLLVPRGGREQS